MTLEELKTLEAAGTIREHHTASRRGYISRKSAGKIEAYKGRFGTGYALITPRRDTSQYVYVTYFVEVDA